MKSHDDSKLSKYVTYYNANDLYEWAMNQYLCDSKINPVQNGSFWDYSRRWKGGKKVPHP